MSTFDKVIKILQSSIRAHERGSIEVEERVGGDSFLYANLSVYAEATPARFQGSYLCPPDPDIIEYDIIVRDAHLYNHDDGRIIATIDKEEVQRELSEIFNQ